jgi:aryl-alcohol dehydrogenase-like predicted oxidoreductase
MEKRKFGNTGLEVSILGFGAMHIGSAMVEDAVADKMLNEVLDLGINLIDTARAYGQSERRIGQFISHRRSEFILSTKVGYDVQWQPDWTYEAVVGGIDQALKLMKTETIDIVHLHSCSLDILEKGDVIRGLEKQKKEGKVRFIAYSGENEALKYAVSSGKFDSIQASVNICDQRIIDDPLPEAVKRGLGVIAKRPIANAPWRHSSTPVGHYSAEYWHRLKKMSIDPHGMDWLELALRFSAYTEGVSTCIAGTSSTDHLKENLRALEKGPLAPEITQHIRSEFQKNDDNWVGLI